MMKKSNKLSTVVLSRCIHRYEFIFHFQSIESIRMIKIIFETKQAKQQLDLMKLRQEEINKLERHIQLIRELFFDLAHLVESQVILELKSPRSILQF